MTLRFRDATRDDVQAIFELLTDDRLGAEREIMDPQLYLQAFDTVKAEGGNAIIVGEQDGRIVATFQLTFISGLSHRATRRAQVESVRVAGDLRDQGIGRQMMEEAERRAVEAGCSILQLTTHGSRDRARAFYDSLGYEPSHIGYKATLPR